MSSRILLLSVLLSSVNLQSQQPPVAFVHVTVVLFVVPGFAVQEELRNLVSLGFTPYEAIRAGTRDAAEFLKSQNQWGTIAPGLRADLILLEANPLQEVSNVDRRVGVMVHGRWMPEVELKERLEQLVQSYAHTEPVR